MKPERCIVGKVRDKWSLIYLSFLGEVGCDKETGFGNLPLVHYFLLQTFIN